MMNEHEIPELNMIFRGAWDRANKVSPPSNPASHLEAVIAECWNIMTPVQRDNLMNRDVVANLCTFKMPESAEVVSIPHLHHALTYSSHPEEEAAFQQVVGVWYQIADILRQMPAGTVAAYQGGSLVMGEMGGELFLFDSMDLSRTCSDWNTFRPDDFNGIGASDLNDIHELLVAWLESPKYAAPINPELISATIKHNYDAATSQPYWTWRASASA
jgi:hypothetical protein